MSNLYSYKSLGANGRLGNQCFQVASTVGIAIREGGEPRFPEWYYRRYFNLLRPEYDDWFSLTGSDDGHDFGLDYLQDLKYFGDIEGVIRYLFTPTSMTETQLYNCFAAVWGVDTLDHFYNSADAVAVHLRRGDYVNLPYHHPLCDEEYFRTAFELAKPKQIVVFSDDTSWCQEQSIFKDFKEVYWAHTDMADIFEVLLMSKMKKHIISNSTFSWWGAWLADSQEVYYPRPWYGQHLQHIDVEGTMIPQNGRWHAIEREIP